MDGAFNSSTQFTLLVSMSGISRIKESMPVCMCVCMCMCVCLNTDTLQSNTFMRVSCFAQVSQCSFTSLPRAGRPQDLGLQPPHSLGGGQIHSPPYVAVLGPPPQAFSVSRSVAVLFTAMFLISRVLLLAVDPTHQEPHLASCLRSLTQTGRCVRNGPLPTDGVEGPWCSQESPVSHLLAYLCNETP